MIAEYERAQIARALPARETASGAQRGWMNVLSGAPYGYRYVRKSDDVGSLLRSDREPRPKWYGWYLQIYTQQGLSINAIARMLNERQIPTRTGNRALGTIHGVGPCCAIRPIEGRACYGKTELRPRQRITRPLRQRKGHAESQQRKS